jgi:hypothetical protein
MKEIKNLITFFFPFPPAAPAFNTLGILSLNLSFDFALSFSFAFSFSVLPYLLEINAYHLYL